MKHHCLLYACATDEAKVTGPQWDEEDDDNLKSKVNDCTQLLRTHGFGQKPLVSRHSPGALAPSHLGDKLPTHCRAAPVICQYDGRMRTHSRLGARDLPWRPCVNRQLRSSAETHGPTPFDTRDMTEDVLRECNFTPTQKTLVNHVGRNTHL